MTTVRESWIERQEEAFGCSIARECRNGHTRTKGNTRIYWVNSDGVHEHRIKCLDCLRTPGQKRERVLEAAASKDADEALRELRIWVALARLERSWW